MASVLKYAVSVAQMARPAFLRGLVKEAANKNAAPPLVVGVLTLPSSDDPAGAPGNHVLSLRAPPSLAWYPVHEQTWTTELTSLGRWRPVNGANNSGPLQEQQKQVLAPLASPPVLLLGAADDSHGAVKHLNSATGEGAAVVVVAGSAPFVAGTRAVMYCSAVLSAWDPAHASQGLVGAALVATNKDGSNDEEVTHTEVSVQYRGLVPLGPRVTVARAAGNVVLELDASSADATVPTAVLLKQLAARVGTRSKDGAVYAAVYEPDSNHTDGPTVVVEISAGDPSRGSLALATQWQQADVWSLAPGTGIRFFEAGNQPKYAIPTLTVNGCTIPCEHGIIARAPGQRLAMLHGAHAHVTVTTAALETDLLRVMPADS